MERISFDDFYSKYKIKRNPEEQTSMYCNTMINFDNDGLDIVERVDPKTVWTLSESKDTNFVLIPGILYKNSVIGYFVGSVKWDNVKENYELV